MGLSAQNITKESDMYQWLEQVKSTTSSYRDLISTCNICYPKTISPFLSFFLIVCRPGSHVEQDLVKASAQRDSVTPWIVVMLHRPLYCMENVRHIILYDVIIITYALFVLLFDVVQLLRLLTRAAECRLQQGRRAAA